MSVKENSIRLGIVVAEYHKGIADAMVHGAKEAIKEEGASLARVVGVPGAYEIPLVVKAMMADPSIGAVVVLGFIEKGETLHGEVMGHIVHKAILDLELQYAKPVGLSIIGPGATEEQAHARKVEYAKSAVRAAVAMARLLGDKS